jgi:hypothetical protein
LEAVGRDEIHFAPNAPDFQKSAAVFESSQAAPACPSDKTDNKQPSV